MAKGSYNIAVSGDSNLKGEGKKSKEAENQECLDSCPAFLRSLSFHDRRRSSRVRAEKELLKSRYKALVSTSLEKIPSIPLPSSEPRSEFSTYQDFESLGIHAEADLSIYNSSSPAADQETVQIRPLDPDSWNEDRHSTSSVESEKLLEKTIAILRTVDKDISQSLANLTKPESIALESVMEVYRNKGKGTGDDSADPDLGLSTESLDPIYENWQSPIQQRLSAEYSSEPIYENWQPPIQKMSKNVQTHSTPIRPNKLQARSSLESPQNVQGQSSLQSPQNVQPQSSLQSPQNVQPQSSLQSPQNVQPQSSLQSPRNVQPQSSLQTPQSLHPHFARESLKNLLSHSSKQNPENLQVRSSKKSTKNAEAHSTPQRLKTLQIGSPRQSRKNVQAQSSLQSSTNSQSQSARKIVNLLDHSSQQSPKDLQALSSQHSPKNLQARSSKKSAKNVHAHSALQRPNALQTRSPQQRPENMQALSSLQSPKDLQPHLAKENQKDLQAHSSKQASEILPTHSQSSENLVHSADKTLKNFQPPLDPTTTPDLDGVRSVEQSPRNFESSPKTTAPDDTTEVKSNFDFHLPTDHEQFLKMIGALQNRCLEYREMIQDIAVSALDECLNFSDLSINRIRRLRKQFVSQKRNFRDFKELCSKSVVFGPDSQPIDQKVTELIQSFYLKLLQEENETFIVRVEFGLKMGDMYAKMLELETESKKTILTLEKEILYLKKTSVGFRV